VPGCADDWRPLQSGGAARTRAAALRRCKLAFCRPPTSALATFGSRQPAASFDRAERSPVAVAEIRMLAELARTICRHRAVNQGQAWCFAQQIALARSFFGSNTADATRRERDRTVVSSGVRRLGPRARGGVLRGVLASSLAEQRSQGLDHGDVLMIPLMTMRRCGSLPQF